MLGFCFLLLSNVQFLVLVNLPPGLATRVEGATSLKMAANEFIVANSACYDRMRIDIGKPVTDVVTGAGLFLTYGALGMCTAAQRF